MTDKIMLPPHPKIAEQLRDLQELAMAMGQAKVQAVMRNQNRTLASEEQKSIARCAKLEGDVSALKRDVVERDNMIARLKELFTSHREVMMPASPSNATSPRAHHHHTAQGEEDKENSAETQQQDDGKNNEKISGGSNARPKKTAHGKKSSVGGRLEAERAKLERVDEQRRSLQQRREREEAYSEAIKTRDSEIKLLRQKLSRAKEQADNEAMRREQEAYIAKQALKHV